MRLLPLLSVVCLLLSSCTAGQKALHSAVESSWPGVRGDAERSELSPGEVASLDVMESAVMERKTGRMLTGWVPVSILVERGIASDQEAGNIGPGVAGLLRDRAKDFEEAIQELNNGR